MSRFSLSDKAFDRLNILFVSIITIIIIYPLIFVLSASISDPQAVNTGKMWLWPVDITFDGFQRVFQNDAIWTGYKNTIIYTIVGVLVHLFVLLPAAYALSRKELLGKKLWLWFILFTMLFNGGLIPTYLVVRNLQMLDTMWAIVIPGVVGAWSILVARTFFQQTIPDQLVEASKIDGASDFYLFIKVVLPLSLPIIAVMALFHGVALWNQYFNALIYLRTEDKFPLQLILRQILILNEVNASSISNAAGSAQSFAEQVKTASLVKYAVIIVSALPLLIVYPFLQRFFVKGVLIGSVKE
ncbi:carbohydrate ABC transporter permease [Oceanobacillus kimchii]|uniref:Sugar ABC transporter permease n=1 Tax=Oceanobacillus kimchii TaxID=746691 RepID=A0ABQ5TQG9_9BACI|nr:MULTISPECIES: carbohydrate ABC transporter permease [Oceanobacillus]MBT2599675.1 carbohydrate ABC transporter permease [Oceanobacillus sp. ISL-74]MCT1576868.1 carbohydrate ABC transporter permease [Oceanobacillus kimchii]MCT2134938.1 carbohydrate ABC transporter permease [Oceanobacillus kimchii]OEH56222.1 sugar ABC transporter permease [Oceanobacillus sp. E9]GLO67903.1 sugar ABC transporter permease [Oceanobacillus kimchii]